MKRLSTIGIVFLMMTSTAAQDVQTESSSSAWSVQADANFYFIPQDFFILPVVRTDKDWLHLELRYNYEDRQTVSGWFGYNFSGGNRLEYAITPMVGLAAGLANGIAPGLEFTLTLGRFGLYNESEYLFDFEGEGFSFFYSWADLTYAPTDWLWVGLSGQRTRLYQTDLEIQRGLITGVAWKQLEVNGYLYNIGFDDPFFLLTVSMGF